MHDATIAALIDEVAKLRHDVNELMQASKAVPQRAVISPAPTASGPGSGAGGGKPPAFVAYGEAGRLMTPASPSSFAPGEPVEVRYDDARGWIPGVYDHFDSAAWTHCVAVWIDREKQVVTFCNSANVRRPTPQSVAAMLADDTDEVLYPAPANEPVRTGGFGGLPPRLSPSHASGVGSVPYGMGGGIAFDGAHACTDDCEGEL